MNIDYVLCRENAVEPEQGTPLAGGWDIVAAEIEQVAPDIVHVHTGLKMTPEDGHKLTIVARSNITKTNWIIQNSPILGDEDYIGEYQIRYRAFPIGCSTLGVLQYPKFPWKVGDRVAQMYAETVIPLTFTKKEELKETVRGEGGFGSTGV